MNKEKLHDVFFDPEKNDLSFERLIAILNDSYDGLLLSDVDGRIFYMNDAVERISGLKNEEMLGLTPEEMQKQGYILSQSKKILKKNPLTIVQKLRNGKEIFTTSRPVVDQKENVICYIATFRDLVELNELHQEHQIQREMDYQELQELRSLFLSTEEIVTNSLKIKKVLEKAVKVAKSDATVLINGESGVGKELVAKTIHNTSIRAENPYIQINCGAIPETLIEAELFGYEKSAFTGADRPKAGLLEVAQAGTVLLDEIGDLPLNVQVKLLRVIQTGEFYRVGSTTSRKLNVRYIAATHRDLKKMVQEGLFREDLYYRLNVIPIDVPPLRERKEDILPLAFHFLNKYNKKNHLSKRLDKETSLLLEQYSWPGNVRQLQNVIERMVIMSEEDIITPSVFPEELLPQGRKEWQTNSQLPFDTIIPLAELREMTEKEMIERALKTYGSIRQAAKHLQVDHSTVIRKIKKYRIDMNVT
ncbi:sigma-54 interaction domain-containing protein [Alkalihalobacillus deserti]|uniref:sigma-54 interaction domain-containing protein n=1 Tax=Alkalihalobacillus deserti TaxID=2879466 RepID=UPI001D152036|nr:sigma 54-interacting transcriptional regulator [Alkalihalobacillus deserti]